MWAGRYFVCHQGVLKILENPSIEERISDIIYKVIGKEEDKEDSIISLSVVSGNVRAVMRKIPLSERVYKTQLLIDSKKILEKLSELDKNNIENVADDYWQHKVLD